MWDDPADPQRLVVGGTREGGLNDMILSLDPNGAWSLEATVLYDAVGGCENVTLVEDGATAQRSANVDLNLPREFASGRFDSVHDAIANS